jgi:hypothetical protein
VAEGLTLRTWRTGPRAGQPKLGPAAQSLLDRGFVSLDPHSRLPRLFFTETGLAALRAMMRDRRLADPERFAHIRVELGIDPPTEARAAPSDYESGYITLGVRIMPPVRGGVGAHWSPKRSPSTEADWTLAAAAPLCSIVYETTIHFASSKTPTFGPDRASMAARGIGTC